MSKQGINLTAVKAATTKGKGKGKVKSLDIDTIAEKLKPVVVKMTENLKKAEILKLAGIEVNQVDGNNWKAAAEKVGLVTVIKKGPKANWGKVE